MMFDRTSIPLAINAPIPIFVTADVSLKFLGIESPPRRASTMPEQKHISAERSKNSLPDEMFF